MLSNNEKTLAAVAVIGLVGWFMFGKKIKKSLKGNPQRTRRTKKSASSGSTRTRRRKRKAKPTQARRFAVAVKALEKQGYNHDEAVEEIEWRWGINSHSRISWG
jgi:hypothetical protein